MKPRNLNIRSIISQFRLCCYALFLFCSVAATAQSRTGMLYWDVDRLYDTIPALFYDDSDFTPQGSMRWTKERYEQKIINTAAVIDSMSLPLVGLFGVENEDVVRDLVEACQGEYCYIHHTRNSFDGLDFALLYFGDRFFPEEDEVQRDMLMVSGEIDGEPLTMIFTINGRDLSSYDLIEDENVVVMGRFRHSQAKEIGFTDELSQSERRGYGTTYGFRGWYMRDRVAVNDGVETLDAGVYINSWMLSPENYSPLPTFRKREYVGGYSSNLPIYIFFR